MTFKLKMSKTGWGECGLGLVSIIKCCFNDILEIRFFLFFLKKANL